MPMAARVYGDAAASERDRAAADFLEVQIAQVKRPEGQRGGHRQRQGPGLRDRRAKGP